MRKTIYGFLIISMLIILSACGENDKDDELVVWDISPAEIIIKIIDEEGNDLLNPNVKGNWFGCAMNMGFDNELYPVKWGISELSGQSRVYLAHFKGMEWTYLCDGYNNPTHYILKFGEFQGETNRIIETTFMIEELNTIFQIKLDHKLIWENREPHFDDHIYLNGERYYGNTIVLTLPQR